MPTRTELTSDELNFLRSVFPGELLLSPEELLVYRSDASLIQGTPLACVCPENTDQVQKLMAWADEVRMPIYIRGRGTNRRRLRRRAAGYYRLNVKDGSHP